jgi:hypothetical protein
MGLWGLAAALDVDRLKAARDFTGLQAGLRHRHATIRQRCAVALASFGEAEGVAFLLRHYHGAFGSAALDELVRVASVCREPLTQALNHDDINVRHRAVVALSALGAAGPVERVLAVLVRDRCEYLSGVYEDRCGMPASKIVQAYGELARPYLLQALEHAGRNRPFVEKALRWLSKDGAAPAAPGNPVSGT